jgi:spermidine synthase
VPLLRQLGAHLPSRCIVQRIAEGRAQPVIHRLRPAQRRRHIHGGAFAFAPAFPQGAAMTPRELIDVAQIPGGGELRLFRRGGDFMIVLDRNELMSSRMSGSEEALATMSCDRLGGRSAPRMLIGGYGMGFTLRAALARLDAQARVTVAELVPEIIRWARGPMEALAAGCLDDPRVTLVERDVAAVIAEGAGAYDAILLDVDNGPDGLVRLANDRLYAPAGLAAAKAALRPGGVLAIWSAAPDAAFARRLGQAGFLVDEVAVKARSNGKGPRHVIWFATKR